MRYTRSMVQQFRYKLRLVFTVFAITLLLPAIVSAQSIGIDAPTGAPFTVSVNPQYPMPYSKASLSFLSASLNLTNATMAVLVSGKEIYKGSVRPVAVTLGREGSITNVEVKISSGGLEYRQTLSIQPEDVTLVAEPISSIPPLYPGKSLVPLEGSVRVVAMANLRNASGKALDPNTLAYAWTVDGVRIANSSGIGKDTIMVVSPMQYRARDVSVSVISPDGSLASGASLTLLPVEPSIRIYENDPLLGIRYDRALSNHYAITDAESALYAAPFSLSTTNGAPLIKWSLNGNIVQTGNSITLRPSGKGQGDAALSIVALAGSYTANMDLSLSFGAKSGSNFFGL